MGSRVVGSSGRSASRTLARNTRSGGSRYVAACTNSSGTVCRPEEAGSATTDSGPPDDGKPPAEEDGNPPGEEGGNPPKEEDGNPPGEEDGNPAGEAPVTRESDSEPAGKTWSDPRSAGSGSALPTNLGSGNGR